MSHGNGNGHGGHGDPGHGVAVHAPAQLTTSDGERAVVRAIDPDTADRIGIAVMDLQEGRPLPHLKWGPEGTYHHAPPSHATVLLWRGDQVGGWVTVIVTLADSLPPIPS